MANVRLAKVADLTSLLELFRVSDVSASAAPKKRAEQIWSTTLSREGVSVFVSAADAQIVATCMLITAPNLLRAGHQHGFLENVVTHPEFRGQGHGRAVACRQTFGARQTTHENRSRIKKGIWCPGEDSNLHGSHR
ncbi:MAG: GNAT family N-acetyltransferase [Rhizobiales bacterium]|nr:GNAT family N-acetyltransferase [Hyphomicrobiales bacterium]